VVELLNYHDGERVLPQSVAIRSVQHTPADRDYGANHTGSLSTALLVRPADSAVVRASRGANHGP